MEHLSLSRLSLLGGEPVIEDPAESEHLSHCLHCMKLLRWFAEDRVDVDEFLDHQEQHEAVAAMTAVTTTL
jgi:hypothetical protein